MCKIPIVVVVGPTASGKTGLALHIAEKFGGEVVSADSMQIYKGMEIASAAPTAEEIGNIPHHMIGCVLPTSRFTVADYVKAAGRIIADIYKRGKLPVLAGGTGLYIDCLINGTDFSSESDAGDVRRKLEREADEKGLAELYGYLCKTDPISAKRISPSDRKRIIRAIEIFELHGVTKSELDARAVPPMSPYSPIFIGLRFDDRRILWKRIEQRVKNMVKNGLVEEAQRSYLSPFGDTASQAIGHKELYPYFKGEKSLDECLERLVVSTRQYSKRQMTWFNKNKDINWIAADKCSNTAAAAYEIIMQNGGEDFAQFFGC